MEQTVAEGLSRKHLSTELRHLWRIAWPLFVAQMAQMGTGVVDTVMAGRYNVQDLAAIAIGYNIWLPVFLLLLGVLFASATIVAQDFGAGRIDKIRGLLPQSLWVAVFLTLALSPMVWLIEPLLNLLDLDPATGAKSLAYTQMVALGLPAVGFFHALRFHTQGLGVTKPFAVASVLGFLANIPLNYAFIYGRLGAPELGAEGCGIATAISMWLSLVLIGAYMVQDRSVRIYLPRRQPIGPRWEPIREILALGIPMGLTFFLEVGVFSFIALLVATLGDTAMASHQIAFNIWDVFYIPMLAIGSAMSTRIGHAIGAGNRIGVFRAMWVGILVSAFIGLATTLVLLTVPGMIIAIYTDSTEIGTLATRLIKLAAFFILIDAAQIIGSFILRAFKETRFPFIVMLVSYWLVALPLGWWLGLEVADSPGDGAAGFWYATIAGIAVCATLIGLRARILIQRPLPSPERFEPDNPTGLPDAETA